jgi:hypothetical protein
LLLAVAFGIGWYLVVLLPMFVAGLIGFSLLPIVSWAHCRNRWLAGVVGVITGIASFLGYFEFCFLYEAPQIAKRLDLLPRYISFRMENDTAKCVRPSVVGLVNELVGNKPRNVDAAKNWTTFSFEMLLMAVIPAAAAWYSARGAYCSELELWLQQCHVTLPNYCGYAAITAIESGTLAQFVANIPKKSEAKTNSILAIEYVESNAYQILDYPVYLSIRAIPKPGTARVFSEIHRTQLRQLRLDVAEVLTLRPLFPRLAERLAAQYPQLRESAT